jgi:hypothetical protein
METYTIYHLHGIKVGCTKRYEARIKENIAKFGPDIIHEVLEIVVGGPKDAGNAERFHAKRFGYKRGYDYEYTISAVKNSRASPKRSSQNPTHQTKFMNAAWTALEAPSECPYCGKQRKLCGLISWHFERCKLNPNRVSRKPNLNSFGNAKRNKIVRTCPHCGLTGRGPNMISYHFDKCKLKPADIYTKGASAE